MKELDFLVKKFESIDVDCYSSGLIYINIYMEHDRYGNIKRAIEISKEKDKIGVRCYESWGNDGDGAQYIFDDELQAIAEFLSVIKTGQDQISQISSLLLKSEFDSITMYISASIMKFIWNKYTSDQYSCSISKNKELCFEGDVPDYIVKVMPQIADLVWDDDLENI